MHRLPTLTLAILLLALATLAFAQAPSATAARVFDRVIATEVPCTEIDLLADVARVSDFAYCGLIDDALTDVNKRWTTEEYQADGYDLLDPWSLERSGAGGSALWMAGFDNRRHMSIAMLMVSGDVDITIILLSFRTH